MGNIWWLHNPIADLPGPEFVLLYAAVVAALVVETIWRKSRADQSLELGVPPVPLKPDPVALAYLRGGANEVARLTVFDLIRRELLGTTSSKIVRTDSGEPTGKLSAIEQETASFFRDAKPPGAMFRPGGLTARLDPLLEPTRQVLREEELIPAEGSTGRAVGQWLIAAGLVLALGGYKLMVAIQKGHHNVAFLILIAVIGLAVLALAARVPRQTRRGKEYLSRLTEAYSGLKHHLSVVAPDRGLETVLAASLFGMIALKGGPHEELSRLFRQSDATSGCGAACGGGAGGGCGGGGGGGGCGGGGCGGGCGGCGG